VALDAIEETFKGVLGSPGKVGRQGRSTLAAGVDDSVVPGTGESVIFLPVLVEHRRVIVLDVLVVFQKISQFSEIGLWYSMSLSSHNITSMSFQVCFNIPWMLSMTTLYLLCVGRITDILFLVIILHHISS
jgi:hypothetical protein